MSLTLSYDAHSEIGLVRTTNQDSAYTSPRMLIVADGMGGAAAGDLASAVATWEIRDTDADWDAHIDEAHRERLAGEPLPSPLDGLDLPEDVTDTLAVMADTLARANDHLVALVDDDSELTGMGTTVCGFVLDGDRMAVVNIGDSRAYLIRDGALHRVTRDHSWVQTLVDDGRITEEEALEHPHRSLVLRVLNGSAQHEPDLGWLDVSPGDRLLVCSDGLCGLVTDAAIASVVTAGLPRQETIDGLVDLAHRAGGYDNITLIVADVEDDGPTGPTAIIGAAAIVDPVESVEHTASLAALPDTDDAPDPDASEHERYALSGRRRPATVAKLTLAVVLPLLVLTGGAFGWYQYTQTRYFIGPAESQVGLYRGVPDTIVGVSLSSLLESDTTRIADLPPYYAERVRATIEVSDLEAARSTLVELREKAKQCIAQREARASATATPTPDATATPDPTATPDATALPGASTSPTPTAAPVTAPEEC